MAALTQQLLLGSLLTVAGVASCSLPPTDPPCEGAITPPVRVDPTLYQGTLTLGLSIDREITLDDDTLEIAGGALLGIRGSGRYVNWDIAPDSLVGSVSASVDAVCESHEFDWERRIGITLDLTDLPERQVGFEFVD